MTITLTPDLEEALDREAQNQGTSPEDIALQTLRRNHLPVPVPQEISSDGTLYNTILSILETLPLQQHASGISHLSERTGEKFTEILLEKQAEERKRYAQWLQEQKMQDYVQP